MVRIWNTKLNNFKVGNIQVKKIMQGSNQLIWERDKFSKYKKDLYWINNSKRLWKIKYRYYRYDLDYVNEDYNYSYYIDQETWDNYFTFVVKDINNSEQWLKWHYFLRWNPIDIFDNSQITHINNWIQTSNWRWVPYPIILDENSNEKLFLDWNKIKRFIKRNNSFGKYDMEEILTVNDQLWWGSSKVISIWNTKIISNWSWKYTYNVDTWSSEYYTYSDEDIITYKWKHYLLNNSYYWQILDIREIKRSWNTLWFEDKIRLNFSTWSNNVSKIIYHIEWNNLYLLSAWAYYYYYILNMDNWSIIEQWRWTAWWWDHNSYFDYLSNSWYTNTWFLDAWLIYQADFMTSNFDKLNSSTSINKDIDRIYIKLFKIENWRIDKLKDQSILLWNNTFVSNGSFRHWFTVHKKKWIAAHYIIGNINSWRWNEVDLTLHTTYLNYDWTWFNFR